MIMKLKEEARAHGGCRASEKKMVKDTGYEAPTYVIFSVITKLKSSTD
jgi:hypothetical protein